MSVSVSSQNDHLLVIHLKSNNDLVVSLQPDHQGASRVGEAIGVLVNQFSKYALFVLTVGIII